METTKSRSKRPSVPILLSLTNPDAAEWEMQQVRRAIAERAHELFLLRGSEHGQDWEDWFHAESEMLRPVSVALSESQPRISVRANVLGFNQYELRLCVEPHRLIILGQREHGTPSDVPDQIMRIVDLPAEVLPEAAMVELQEGFLKFELPKATQAVSAAAGQ